MCEIADGKKKLNKNPSKMKQTKELKRWYQKE
jgi:hypothetical protein